MWCVQEMSGMTAVTVNRTPYDCWTFYTLLRKSILS